MKAILDVHYHEGMARAACVIFNQWPDSEPMETVTVDLAEPARYRPGHFADRELPCLQAVLAKACRRFDHLLVDGYVHLQSPLLEGLGGHLANHLDYRASVIGVAKHPLRVADRFLPVFRGRSTRPLFVSAANCPLAEAVAFIAAMHGPYRIPTLVRLADRLSRN